MIKMKYPMVLLVLLVLGACVPEVSHECPMPPEGFKESDLIGTWDAIGERGNNTIIIREDSRYKQIMIVEWQGFKYESDWKPWRVTYSDKGLPYLHLEEFLMCAYWRSMDCKTGNTGITPVVVGDTKDPFAGEYYWYDFCERKWVETPGEGVFMVFGVPRASIIPPRGITLVPFTKSAGESTGSDFELRRP